MSSVRPNATLTCSKTQYCVAFNATDTVAHSSGSFWAPGLVGQAVNAHNSAQTGSYQHIEYGLHHRA